MKMVEVEFSWGMAYVKAEVTEEQAAVLNKIADDGDEFSAYFWTEKCVWKNNGDVTEDGQKVFRSRGQHQVIGKEDAVGGFRGCGGATHYIKFTSGAHEGQVIKSTNVWHQGLIPDELAHILTDNAEIIYEHQKDLLADLLPKEVK